VHRRFYGTGYARGSNSPEHFCTPCWACGAPIGQFARLPAHGNCEAMGGGGSVSAAPVATASGQCDSQPTYRVLGAGSSKAGTINADVPHVYDQRSQQQPGVPAAAGAYNQLDNVLTSAPSDQDATASHVYNHRTAGSHELPRMPTPYAVQCATGGQPTRAERQGHLRPACHHRARATCDVGSDPSYAAVPLPPYEHPTFERKKNALSPVY